MKQALAQTAGTDDSIYVLLFQFENVPIKQ